MFLCLKGEFSRAKTDAGNPSEVVARHSVRAHINKNKMNHDFQNSVDSQWPSPKHKLLLKVDKEPVVVY